MLPYCLRSCLIISNKSRGYAAESDRKRMKKLIFPLFLLVLALASASAQDARTYNENKTRLMAIAVASEEPTLTKPRARHEAQPKRLSDLPEIPSIVMSAVATGPNVVLAYSSLHRSIVALSDLDGDGEVDSFTLYIKRVETPVSAIVPLGDKLSTIFASLLGNGLLKLTTAGYAFNPPRQEFIGVAGADALTYYTGDEPVLSIGYLSEMLEYRIIGERISIGTRAQLPALPNGDGTISLDKDSRGNAYAITQNRGGNLIWKIPVAPAFGLAWKRAFPIGSILGAVHLAVDRATDDLYVAAARAYIEPPTPQPPPPPAGQTTEGGGPAELPSRIYVFKNVAANPLPEAMLFAFGEPLEIEYSPAGGIIANNGVIFVGATRYGQYQTISEILQYRAGPKGTAAEIKRFLPAELAGIGFYSGLAILR